MKAFDVPEQSPYDMLMMMQPDKRKLNRRYLRRSLLTAMAWSLVVCPVAAAIGGSLGGVRKDVFGNGVLGFTWAGVVLGLFGVVWGRFAARVSNFRQDRRIIAYILISGFLFLVAWGGIELSRVTGIAPSEAGILGALRASSAVKYALAAAIGMGALAIVVSTDLLSRQLVSEPGKTATPSHLERAAYACVVSVFMAAQALSLVFTIPMQWFHVD